MSRLTPSEWEGFLKGYPDAHLLQSADWGALKAGFGWSAAHVVAGTAGAQVLFRGLPGGFSLAYIPKGPVAPEGPKGADWRELWPEVDALCRERRAIFLKVEPDGEALAPEEAEDLLPGFRPSPQSIQPRRTILVDLTGSEDEILARMKQKTRYNIRLAEKKDVSVRPWADLDGFFELMTATGARDGFGVHSREYYRRAYELFAPRGACALLAAEYAGRPLAALMVFAHGGRAWYFYGASSDAERSRMPTYLLQWEAMRWARARGCRVYDLWGIPDADEEELEAGFTARADGLWGVYRFKRGFGGRVTRSAGAWDRVYLSPLYALYRWWLARRPSAAA